jgi:osmotically-inducible protein OsmY
MSTNLRAVHLLASACVLTATLTGCATYEKCGFEGCSGDAKITQNVQTLFDQHPELAPPNLINIQTLDRVVYLNGEATTGLERREAESVAQEASGVTRVVDLIDITR